MLTPVTDFGRLLEPSPHTTLRPLTSHLWSSGTAESAPYAARSATGSLVLRRAPRLEPEDLGFPSPPARLRVSARRTQDAYHHVRPCELSPAIKFHRGVFYENAWNLRTGFAFSPPPLVVRRFPHEGSVSFGLGTCFCSRPVALQRHAGQAPSIRPSDECHSNFSTTSTRTRWFPIRP